MHNFIEWRYKEESNEFILLT